MWDDLIHKGGRTFLFSAYIPSCHYFPGLLMIMISYTEKPKLKCGGYLLLRFQLTSASLCFSVLCWFPASQDSTSFFMKDHCPGYTCIFLSVPFSIFSLLPCSQVLYTLFQLSCAVEQTTQIIVDKNILLFRESV